MSNARRRLRQFQRARHVEATIDQVPALGHSLDCGCTARRLHWLDELVCSRCGESFDWLPLVFPTAAHPGEVKQMMADCSCGAELTFRAEVVA